MWLWLALTTAFLHGISTVLSKHLLAETDDRIVGWGTLFFALPWLFLGTLAYGWPKLSWEFWGLVAVLIPLELTAFLCYLRAIRISPLSLTVPFLALTPLLTVVTGWLFLGEQVGLMGLAGVVMVTVGAYVLQAELVPQGLLEPIKAMFRVPGIRLMLITAALFSLTSPLGKRAMELSGPASFPFLYFSLDTVVLTLLAWHAAKGGGGLVRAVRPRIRLFLLAGLVTGMMLLTHCIGVVMAPVAYFISIKRLSLMVSVLYGGLFFKEAGLPQRLMGCALMIAGVALISLG